MTREGIHVPGTKIGGQKAAATNRAKYDAEYMEKYGMTFY
jgi:hypothetical protein